jgi:putative transposase
MPCGYERTRQATGCALAWPWARGAQRCVRGMPARASEPSVMGERGLYASSRQRQSGRYRGGSLRLPGYDYAEAGAYAVTIRAWGGQPLFGEVVDGVVHLNAYGDIAQSCCEEIPLHFPHAWLDTCVVMPDHLHAIVVLRDWPQQCGSQAREHGEGFGRPVRGSLPRIIRSLKSAVTKRINELRGRQAGSVWQRGYYEHVIRDDCELQEHRQYILENPCRWSLQREV